MKLLKHMNTQPSPCIWNCGRHVTLAELIFILPTKKLHHIGQCNGVKLILTGLIFIYVHLHHKVFLDKFLTAKLAQLVVLFLAQLH